MHTQMTYMYMNRTIMTVITALLITSGSFAQSGLIKRADKKYAAFSYIQAARLYELAVGKGAAEQDVASNTADCYWRLRDMRNAERWYAKAVASTTASPKDVYRYSEVLRSNGKIAEADLVLERYKGLAAQDSRTALQNNAVNYVKQLNEQNLLGASVKNLDINSERSDMGVGMLGEQVTFASARRDRAVEERNHTWNDAPFLDLYVADASATGDLTNVRPLDGPFNTKYHESNLSATSAGQQVLFTRNNYDGHKRGKDESGVTGLKMYSTSRSATGPWEKENAFIHNNDRYSVGHPALTPDGNRLYFTSNRPGGKGGTDIWYCEKAGIGGWGPAANAEGINTEGNEMFPFITTDNVLFFASDGHKGLGGLDVMMANVTGNAFSNVRNPGAPINSTADDFGFALRNSTSGYFSSDRPGGKGDDDIYSATITAKLRNELKIDGIVREGNTNAPLAGVLVKRIGVNGETLDSTITDASGRYGFSLAPGQEYSITAEKEDFMKFSTDLDLLTELDTLVVQDLTLVSELGISFLMHVTDLGTGDPLKDVNVNIVEERSPEPLLIGKTNEKGNIRTALEKRAIGDELNMQIRLTRTGYLSKKITYTELIKAYGELKKNESMEVGLQPAAKGDDLGSLIDLKTIYFDVNKADIRPDAAAELNRMVEVMNDNPGIVIELGSHSDCRGSIEYNRVLSDKRAKSSMAYIVSKGIVRSRITGKGYGESKLVNNCPCEGNVISTCTEEQHQLNRRTEFIIKKM